MADLVIENCKSHGPLTRGGATDAVAIRNGRIIALGHDARMAKTATTRTIDAGGAVLLPGFIESHMHIFSGGASLAAVDLSAVHDREALTRALREADHQRPGNDMLTAHALGYQVIGGRNPTRHDLDAIIAHRPLYISAPDLHCAWANTAALQLADALHGADVGRDATVVMGRDGLATGELIEFDAMTLVKRHGPTGGRENMGLRGEMPSTPTGAAERAKDRQTMLDALEWCARHGLTTATSMDGNDWQAGILTDMAQEDALPLRVSAPLTLTPKQTAQHVALVKRWGPGLTGKGLGRDDDMLRFGRIKMFMDGVIDTKTAFMVEPYADEAGGKGAPFFTPDKFAQICIEADQLGLQITTHAVGDGAVRATLDGYEAARFANGARDARHRIEHIELLHPDDLPRFRQLGVTASMQPTHPPGLGGWPLEPVNTLVGPDRLEWSFPWRKILDAGIVMPFSTDWPVTPVDPLTAIHYAISRKPWAAHLPDQSLTLDEALYAYTVAGAYAEFAEDRRGLVAVGMQADLVLIEGDPAALAEAADAVKVIMTICAGQVTYQR